MKEIEISKQMAKIAVHALEEKKAENVKIIEISGVSIIADYFIIAHGNTPVQVEAMVEEVESELAKQGYVPKRIEGIKSSGWVLMDYGDVIVHIFSKEDRLFYDLERIWRDGKMIDEINM